MIDLCAVIDPIYVGRDDILTEDTAQQILTHNLFWRERCQ